MKGFLELGKILGIKIEIHWTFALLLIWIGLVEFENSGNLEKVIISQGLILVLMACVVLHELGHALMARKFNIKTNSIILLPMGGVATLDEIPKKPKQELLIALAGPTVNIIITLILALVIPLRSYFNFDTVLIDEQLYEPTFQNLLFYLFIANLMLVIFNLIPAFPMDGGRVLRALLSFRLSRLEATNIASGIAQGLAILFFIVGLLFNPFLVLIAFFIFFGAYGENQMVKQYSILEGHIAKEATLTNITLLNLTTTLEEVIELVLTSSEKDFVVFDNQRIEGVLHQKKIIENAQSRSLLVGDILDKSVGFIDANTPITEVLERMQKEKNNFFPVTENGEIIGAIDRSNISEFILLKSI